MSRDMSHDGSRLCGPCCLNFILPFDPDAPTAYEMSTFLQMVSHSFKCRFANCYLTAGSLNCRSVKEAIGHCHFRSRNANRCTCLTCQSFSKLYGRHIISCQLPRGQCPFAICGTIKRHVRRQLRQQVAQARAAQAQAQAQAAQAQPVVQAQAQPATDSTANGPQVENASAQQPNNDLFAEIQQNSNVDAEMKERPSQSSTSTSEPLPQKPGEESNAQDRQNPGT